MTDKIKVSDLRETNINVMVYGDDVLMALTRPGGGFERGQEKQYILLNPDQAKALRLHLDVAISQLPESKEH